MKIDGRWRIVEMEPTLKVDRTEALELLAVVQATLNAIARSQELTVGAAVAAAALLAERAAQEISDRDRVIRLANERVQRSARSRKRPD